MILKFQTGPPLFRQKLNEIAFQNQDPSEITDIVEKIEQLILLILKSLDC